MEKLFEYIYSDVKYNRKELYHALRKLSDIFLENGIVNYFDKEKNLFAYLYYFYPQNVLKNYQVLKELQLSKFFNKFRYKKMNVVDLGAGLAPSTAALLLFLGDIKVFPQLEITVVEKSRLAIEYANRLIHKVLRSHRSGKTSIKIFRGDFRKFVDKVDGPFDLIFMSNSFKEFYKKLGDFSFMDRLSEMLSPEGMIVIIEPGARRESRDLIALRNYAITSSGLYIYAPCTFTGLCPITEKKEEWCHISRPWDPPELARDLGNMLKRDFKRIKYSYVVLAKRNINFSRYVLKKAPEGGEVWHTFTELRKEKGKIKIRACNEKKWVEIERLDRHRNENNRDFDKLQSHTLAWFKNLQELQEWVLRVGEDSVVKILYTLE